MMKDDKGIQITRGTKDLARDATQKFVEVSHKGRPISEAIPELVELEFRCGRTRKSFRVLLEGRQTRGVYRYRLVEILKSERSSQGPPGSIYKVKKREIGIQEIEKLSSIKCPYCGGGRSAVIQCGCGGLSCGGGVRREGDREYNECPWCRSVGLISGRIETLSGDKSSSHRGLPATKGGYERLHKSVIADVKTLPPGDKQIQKRRGA